MSIILSMIISTKCPKNKEKIVFQIATSLHFQGNFTENISLVIWTYINKKCFLRLNQLFNT